MDGHKKRIEGHPPNPRRTGNQTFNKKKKKRGNQNNAEVVIALNKRIGQLDADDSQNKVSDQNRKTPGQMNAFPHRNMRIAKNMAPAKTPVE